MYSTENLAWLAGYLQGDGCIKHYSYPTGTPYLLIQAGTIDEEIAAYLATNFEFGKYFFKGKRYSEWRVRLRGKRAEALYKLFSPMMQSREPWPAWAAGFFDAEGSVFFIHPPRKAGWWRIAISNSDVALLEEWTERYGGYINRQTRAYNYIAQCKQARRVAIEILPFTVCRRKSERLRKCLEVKHNV